MAEDYFRKIQKMMEMYQQNPDIFTEKEVQELGQLAQAVGMPFQPKSNFARKAAIFGGKAIDTALLGAIPNRAQLQPRTQGESYASGAGEIAGMITPGGLPSILGRKAATAAGRGLGRLNQLANKAPGVPSTAAELSVAGQGFKAASSVGDFGVYAGQRVRRGIQFTADQMKKYGLEKQAKSFRNFMYKQSQSLDKLRNVDFTQGRLGKVADIGGRIADSGTLQAAVTRGVGFGTQLAAGNLAPNVASGNFDQIISDFMGGASVGAIGGFLSNPVFSKGKGKLFNLRNLSRAIVAYSAGQGIPAQEDRIYARLLTLAGLTVGARSKI